MRGLRRFHAEQGRQRPAVAPADDRDPGHRPDQPRGDVLRQADRGALGRHADRADPQRLSLARARQRGAARARPARRQGRLRHPARSRLGAGGRRGLRRAPGPVRPRGLRRRARGDRRAGRRHAPAGARARGRHAARPRSGGIASRPGDPAPFDPEAFRGLSIRIADNDTSAAVLRTLGATPVEGITAPDVRSPVAHASARGGRDGADLRARERIRHLRQAHHRLRAVRPRRHARRVAGRLEAALAGPAGGRDGRRQRHHRQRVDARGPGLGESSRSCAARASAWRLRAKDSSQRWWTPPSPSAPRCAQAPPPGRCSRRSRRRRAPGRRRSTCRPTAPSRYRRRSLPSQGLRGSPTAPTESISPRPTSIVWVSSATNGTPR